MILWEGSALEFNVVWKLTYELVRVIKDKEGKTLRDRRVTHKSLKVHVFLSDIYMVVL